MESLASLKKELSGLERADLISICARLARHKKENKELLAYLLLDADDPILYAEKIKPLLDEPFDAPFYSSWAFAKRLRKSLRIIAKYQRFTGSARGEAELLIYFLQKFQSDWRHQLHHATIQKIVFRSFDKIEKLIYKVDEDYRFDFEEPLQGLRQLLRGF
jgi:hypothetical protein